MKILMIAMPHSIHTSRWMEMITARGWEIHLFSCVGDIPIHEDIKDVVYYSNDAVGEYKKRGVRLSAMVSCLPVTRHSKLLWILKRLLRRVAPRATEPARLLARVIERLQPDIIHTLETQHSAYLLVEAAKHVTDGMRGTWLHSLWGSDLYLYSRLKAHHQQLRSVMSRIQFLHVECNRDVQIARHLGFAGDVCLHSCFSNGFDLDLIEKLRTVRTSKRRVIAVKGYSGWVYRSLNALSVIERCADVLKDFTVIIYLAAEELRISAELIALRTGLSIQIQERGEYFDVLRLLGSARIAIGLSISDGVPASFLEAMAMGAFPIQSNTACAEEWTQDGVSAALVSPEDSAAVELALRRAVAEDSLVDAAAEINWTTVKGRLGREKMTQTAVSMYEKIFQQTEKIQKP